MDTLIVAVAQYALYVVAAGALVVWLRVGAREKVTLAARTVVAVVLVAVLVRVASALYVDPRPFVQDPSLRPLFAHPADNGFPSDHTALTAAVSAVVLLHRRTVGLGLLALSVLIGVARVLAHVHHWLDIGAGVLVGLVAAGVAAALLGAVRSALDRRRAGPTENITISQR